MAGDAGSELSRGGMKTKIDAGKIATGAGCAMIIASGKAEHPLSAIDRGASIELVPALGNTAVGTQESGLPGSSNRRAVLTIDAGAEKALRSGKSLLPAACQGSRRRLPARRSRGRL
jgi:glutamate 5-kinase